MDKFPVSSGPPVIGVIGGIGSGKSYVAKEYARRFAHRFPNLGLVVIVDGDAAGHEVLEDPEVIEQLRQALGDEVITAEHKVNRKQVSRRVFGPGLAERQARKQLEAIVHPRIEKKLSQQIATARRQAGVQAIFLDAAILLETGWRTLCDAVLFVDCPFEERLERVSEHRGWTAENLTAREASQMPLEQKRKEADFVIVNSRKHPADLPPLEQILAEISRRRASPELDVSSATSPE